MKSLIASLVALAAIALPAHAATPLDTVVVQDGFSAASTTTTFRVLNVAPDAGPIDLYVAQNREAENVGFEEITPAERMTTATFTIRVFRTGEVETPLVETGVTFTQFTETVLVFTGLAGDYELLPLVSGTPGQSPSSAYVRFVHVSPDAVAMDLALTGGESINEDVSYRGMGDYMELPAGTYDFEIREAGQSTVAVAVPGVWLRETRYHTIYLTGLAADEGLPDAEFETFIQAAARTPGEQGSFFVTTLDVLNHGGESASFRLRWLPQNMDNSMPSESETFMVGAGQTVRFDDVLEEAFGVSGEQRANGALIVAADSDEVSAFGRVFNLTDEGTFGQAMSGVTAAGFIPAGTVRRILFMTEDDDFRTNLGILNPTATEIRVIWRLYDADGILLAESFADLPPYGNILRSDLYAGLGRPVVAGWAEIRTVTFGGSFLAYGSVLDNATSDPTTVLPQ